MRRIRLTVPLLTVTTLAALALPAAGSTPLTGTSSHGGQRAVTKVGGWTQVSASKHVSALSEPDALPLATGGAQVVWYQQDGSSSQSIRTRTVKESGAVGASVSTVVSGWATIVDDPRIINHGAQRMVVFGGLRSTSPGEQYDGTMAYATSSNGTSWAQGPGSLTKSQYAYASYGTDAVDDGGTPLVGVIASSSSYVTLHRGIDPSVPAAAADWTTSTSNSCCAYNAALGRDAKTGATWALWYSNSSTASQNGVLAQRVYPTPIGTMSKAPGSSKGASSLDPGQAVAVASRAGGQVWAAYKVGYPTANQIALWRVGTKQRLMVKTSDVRRVALFSGSAGRLWLAWYGGSNPTLKVARTNASVTRLGHVSVFKPPTSKASPYPSLWAIGGSGHGGPLHLFINAQIGIASPQIWYRKVLPGLTLVASPRSLNKGRVVAKVTDAGKAVRGARVTFLGHTKTTSRLGTVRFKVGAAVAKGKKRLTASKAGYGQGHAVVRVT